MIEFARRFLVLMLVVIASLAATPARADLNDCQNLYVGAIWVERGTGLKAALMLLTPTAASGSYWIYFTSWAAEEQKSALAMLTAAKLAGHRVNLTTDNADGCGIGLGGTYMKAVYLATNP